MINKQIEMKTIQIPLNIYNRLIELAKEYRLITLTKGEGAQDFQFDMQLIRDLLIFLEIFNHMESKHDNSIRL